MPKRISITLLFAVAIAIVALFAVTAVWAQPCDPAGNTADYSVTCGEQRNYTVSIVEPFPQIADCGAPYPGEKCSTYRWNIDPSMSHLNLIVEAFFEDKIVASNATPVGEKWLRCDGAGDPSTGAELFGQFLTWHCYMQFPTIAPFVILRGEFGSTPTDWQVKQSNDIADGDYGITRGLAELCEPMIAGFSSSVECLRVVSVDAGTIYMKVQRGTDGCDVDPTLVGFYLNSPTCTSNPLGVPTKDCETGDDICYDDPEPGFQICAGGLDPGCPECVNVLAGSPTCMKYTLSSGTRIKSCFLDDGTTCSWKRCCRLPEDFPNEPCNQ